MNLNAWKFGDLQNVYAVLRQMERNGVPTVNQAAGLVFDAINAVVQRDIQHARVRTGRHINSREKRRLDASATATRVKMPVERCEQCGGRVYLEAVNISKCTRTGDNSKTAIRCHDAGCQHVAYSPRKLKSFPMEWVEAAVYPYGAARLEG